MTRERPPWWLVAGAAGVIALAVVGHFATGWRGRGGETTTTVEQPTAASAVDGARAVVIGDVLSVRREGEPKEPTVVARIRVTDALKGPADEGATITVSDAGFEGAWSDGLHVLLFLRPAAEAEAALAPWRVQHRYEFVDGELRAPFDAAAVRRAAG